ncbi:MULTISPECIES: hypothetical protein [Nocardia]|uniref:hypothetical protein n=1 Tax=Nocardia TaxID=1817 RepID=UPI001E3FDB7C|nr:MULTISPECIES: hypothetical protein [Nocardia]UEX21047.1 hypothetical protein LMJ57_18725 [Nocardia farcinica]
MSEDQTPRPMANLLTAAREGSVSVTMKPEDFIYIDRDCEYFKQAIQAIQSIMDEVSHDRPWGLGEANPDLISAATVVDRFRGKAKGAGDNNSVWKVMEEHYRIVEDIQEVHRIARERMMQADSSFAAEFNRLNETLPQRAPEGSTYGPFLLPDGTTK